jgi:hypothetical protein
MNRLDPQRQRKWLQHGTEAQRQNREGQYLVLVHFNDGSMRTAYTFKRAAAQEMARQFWVAKGDEIDRIIVAHVLIDSMELEP